MNGEYKYNFSKSAQTRFDKFVKNSNWSWVGLSMALIKRFGIQDVEYFHFVLGETLAKLRKEIG